MLVDQAWQKQLKQVSKLVEKRYFLADAAYIATWQSQPDSKQNKKIQ